MKKVCLMILMSVNSYFAFPAIESVYTLSDKSFNDTIKLISQGQSATFHLKGEPKPIEIKFLKVIQDSRCPEGAECIWQGNIIIEVLVDKTLPFILIYGQSPVYYKNFQIRFINAFPNPKLETEIKPEDYKVSIEVILIN